jgi:hypothetical protein
MLAKIAHAVAELGLDGFEHKLPALIFGDDLSLAAYLVGDYAAPFQKGHPIIRWRGELHRMGLIGIYS